MSSRSSNGPAAGGPTAPDDERVTAEARVHAPRRPSLRVIARASLLGILLGPGTPAPPLSSQVPPLWTGLEPGPHGVGFERKWALDSTRVWPRSPAIDSARGEIARPIRVDVWYPASCPPAARMPLRGYLEMEGPGEGFGDAVFLTRRWDEYSYRNLAGDSASYDRLMDAGTAACRDAAPLPGPFPLIVYSAGWFNRAPDNTVLAEALASHGFVVAGIPQLNPGLWTFEFRSDPASVERQVRDLESALGELLADPAVDRRRIAAMGYSTGGDVALLLQARNPLVDAVVGLDASWTLGADNDVRGSPPFDPGAVTVPILALRRPVEDRPAADSVLRTLEGATRLVVEVPRAEHGSFSDDPPQHAFLGSGEAAAVETHAAVVRAVVRFLSAVLAPGDAALDVRALARRDRSEGLDVRILPAADPVSSDSVRTSPSRVGSGRGGRPRGSRDRP